MSSADAQEEKKYNATLLGLGVGLPYGGFGLKLTQQVHTNIDLFGGIGYNLIGPGYNVGMNLNIPTGLRTQFFFTGMYGYNAVIKIKNLEESEKAYYGFSLGTGLRLSPKKYKWSYWDFAILIPFRNQSFKDDQDFYYRSPIVDDFNKAFPLLFSVGYNFQISAEK